MSSRTGIRNQFNSSRLDVLDWRERKVVEYRTGIRNGRPKTLREIGEEFGITRERVRQIENAAAAKLRKASKRPTQPPSP
jgi:RNA polymerase primary sigma factor